MTPSHLPLDVFIQNDPSVSSHKDNCQTNLVDVTLVHSTKIKNFRNSRLAAYRGSR